MHKHSSTKYYPSFVCYVSCRSNLAMLSIVLSVYTSYKFEISYTIFMTNEMITRNSSITFKTMTIDNNSLFSVYTKHNPEKWMKVRIKNGKLKGCILFLFFCYISCYLEENRSRNNKVTHKRNPSKLITPLTKHNWLLKNSNGLVKEMVYNVI